MRGYFIRILALLFVLGALAGCITIEQGVRPKFDRLEGLSLQQSVESDVIAALGKPTGKGFARFPDDPAHRTIWSYEYIKTTIPDVNTRILFVFFRDDHYDGYMWFSSNAVIGGTP
jgi:hypothetical protein